MEVAHPALIKSKLCLKTGIWTRLSLHKKKMCQGEMCEKRKIMIPYSKAFIKDISLCVMLS